MRFKSHRKVMPELVASKDASRPVLTYVHLDADKAQAVVTDSYMLARFPVELDEGDTSGPIPAEALKAARKCRHGETSIIAGERVTVSNTLEGPVVTLPRGSSDYQFPDADRLIPDTTAEFRIALSAEKLHRLAKALGCGNDDAVELRFTTGPNGEPAPLRPIHVRAHSHAEGDGEAILMPVRVAT